MEEVRTVKLDTDKFISELNSIVELYLEDIENDEEDTFKNTQDSRAFETLEMNVADILEKFGIYTSDLYSYILDIIYYEDRCVTKEEITKNTDNLSGISVLIDNGKVNIKLTKNIKGVFGRAFKFDLIEAKSEYVGYILDGNKKIDKVG